MPADGLRRVSRAARDPSMPSRRAVLGFLTVMAVSCAGEECEGNALGPGEPEGYVSITPQQSTIARGGTGELVGAYYSPGGTESIVWTSQDESIVLVQAVPGQFSATITGIGPGTTRVIGSYSPAISVEYADTAFVTVVEVGSIQLDPASSSLAVGQSLGMTAIVTDATGSPVILPITLVSSDPAVATIFPDIAQSSGTLTLEAVGPGMATITASAGPVTGMASVTVDPPVTQVIVSPAMLSVPLGSTGTLAATALDATGTPVTARFTWSSSDAAVASVAPDASTAMATVTGLGLGNVTVTARVSAVGQGAAGTADVEVRPAAPSPALIEGHVLADDGSGLPDMVVRASRTSDNVGFRGTTNAQGYYLIDVSPGGQLNVSGQGIHGRAFSNTEGDLVLATAGQTVSQNLSITKGYHLEVTSGLLGVQAAAGSTFQVQVSYHAWNRSGAPGATTHIVVGVEASSIDVHRIGIAGPYSAQTVDATGSATLTLVAPSTPGSYGLYAMLGNTVTGVESISIYTQRFPNAELFIPIGTLIVPQPM